MLQSQISCQCNEKSEIAIDCETNSLNFKSGNLVGLSIAYDIGKAVYIPLRHINNDNDLFENKKNDDFPNQIEFEKAINLIKPILEDPYILKIGHNIKFDMNVLRQNHNGNIEVSPVDDTMCMSYCTNLGKVQNHKLDTLAQTELNYTTIKYEDLCGKGVNQKTFDLINPLQALNYAAEDSDVALALYQNLKLRLMSDKKNFVYQKLERELISVLSDIENEGIIVNEKTLNSLSETLTKNIIELEKKIFSLTKEEFNIGSPKQLGEILFDKLKLPMIKKRSTAESVLSELKDKHPLPELILSYRKLYKLKNTYLDPLPSYIIADTQRVHSSFNQTMTATGRLSTSSPNFQNIPIRTEDGKEIRKAIKAQSNEYQIFSADYSQVELRVMAHLSGDESLISALNNGEDIHTFTAKNIFNVDNDDMVLPEMRRIAKIVNFGIMYGAGPFRLSQELDIPFGEAKQIKDAYFEKYQGIEQYIENSKLQIKETKSVETLLGRKRAVWDSDSQNKIRRDAAERMAINMPIQGTAAEMIKLAMIKIHRQINKENLKSKLIMQIHDELLLEVHQDEIDYISKMVIEHMRDAMKLDVPIEIDFGVGPSWYEAH